MPESRNKIKSTQVVAMLTGYADSKNTPRLIEKFVKNCVSLTELLKISAGSLLYFYKFVVFSELNCNSLCTYG